MQDQQLGTGHAVMMCRPQLAGHDGPVLSWPAIRRWCSPIRSQSLLAEYDRRQPACLLGTTHKRRTPPAWGGSCATPSGQFQAIVEEKDATEAQRRITEVNMSCYVFHGRDLLFALDQHTGRTTPRASIT